MAGKIMHYRLNHRLARKLERLAELSRRSEADVMRLLLEDGTVEQLGVRKPDEQETVCPAQTS